MLTDSEYKELKALGSAKENPCGWAEFWDRIVQKREQEREREEFLDKYWPSLLQNPKEGEEYQLPRQRNSAISIMIDSDDEMTDDDNDAQLKVVDRAARKFHQLSVWRRHERNKVAIYVYRELHADVDYLVPTRARNVFGRPVTQAGGKRKYKREPMVLRSKIITF